MNKKLIHAVASNAASPSDVLDQAYANAPEPELHTTTHAILARHPNASKDLIGHLLQHPSQLVSHTAAEHPMAKHHEATMAPHLKMLSSGSRHASVQARAELHTHLRSTYGTTLGKYGYKEVPPMPRHHPGRLRFVHHKDNHVVELGVIKMGAPITNVQHGYKFHTYTEKVPVVGWRRYSASSISSPRGDSPATLDKHLARVGRAIKKNPGAYAANHSYGSMRRDGSSWIGNYRDAAKALATPKGTGFDYGEDLLAIAKHFLAEETR